MPRTLKVAVAGLGPVGQAVARLVLQTPGLKLVAAADPAARHAGQDLAGVLGLPRRLGIKVDGDPERWLRLTRTFAAEPEKGRRCDVCYALRLERTARTAAGRGFDYFTTVMSLSPWKKAAVINRIGRQFGTRFGLRFLEADFKKRDGFKKSVDLSRGHGLYRQNYCGCVYSLEAMKARGL